MVEGTGLENRQRGNSFASSNLALSATYRFYAISARILSFSNFSKTFISPSVILISPDFYMNNKETIKYFAC